MPSFFVRQYPLGARSSISATSMRPWPNWQPSRTRLKQQAISIASTRRCTRWRRDIWHATIGRGTLPVAKKGLIIAERKRDLIEIDYASALLGYALGYLDRNEEAGRYLYRANHPTHGLRAGCTRAGMGVTQAMAKVNRLSFLEIVEARIFILSKRKQWAEAHAAITEGLVASESMDPYIEERLLALADGLPENGF